MSTIKTFEGNCQFGKTRFSGNSLDGAKAIKENTYKGGKLMSILNIQATKIIKEFQDQNFEHISELNDFCKEKIKIIANKNNYKFYPDWDIEDFFSEAFLKVWELRMDYDEYRGSFSCWFDMLAKTIYIKHSRKMSHQLKSVSLNETYSDDDEFSPFENVNPSISAEDTFLLNDKEAFILSDIETLPEHYRDVIDLCSFKGLKPSEAALIMDCKAEDVSRWYHRAKNHLRKDLEAYEGLTASYDLDKAA